MPAERSSHCLPVGLDRSDLLPARLAAADAMGKNLFAKHRVLARTAGFLGITGKVQSESGVVNLVPEDLWVPSVEALVPEGGSRDFR
jgi:hypothetical protein